MQTLILDSSQISAWFECPTEWANRGLVAIDKKDPSKTLQPGAAMAMGSLGHKYLELYYTEIGNDVMSGQAVQKAIQFDPDAEDKADSQYPLDPELREKVKKRFLEYTIFYNSGDYKPAYKKTHRVEVRDGILTDAVGRDPLIEKGFSYKLFESSEYLFVLEGRIDFMGEAQDGTLLWMDHKFQLREHLLYSKAIQFRNYALATGLNLAVINYVRLHEKLEKNTFVRQPLSFSSLEMRHWREELIDTYVVIAKQVAAGHFPQNRNSCGGAWGRPCMYTPLCEEYNLQTRAAVQKRDFVARKEWRPW